MHLKLDGHSFLSGLAPLRARRKLPKATLTACPHALGKVAEIVCGDFHLDVPVHDRRCWSDTVEFDGAVLASLASIPADDMFMQVCRVEYIAGRIVFADNLTFSARIVADTEG